MTSALAVLAQVDPVQAESLSLGWLFFKTVLAMVLIIALAIVVIRYVMPKLKVTQFRSSKSIKVLERAGLEPRKGLYVIRVGSKTALVGTADNYIGKIMDLDASDLEGSDK